MTGVTYRYKLHGLRIAYCKFPERIEDVADADRAYYDYPLEEPNDPALRKRRLWRTRIDITVGDDELYHSFDGTARANINRARKDGIVTKINEDYEHAADFARRFYEAKNVPDRGAVYPAIELMKNDSLTEKKHGVLVAAYHDGKMIHGEYFLAADTRMAPELAFSYRIFDSGYERLCGEAIRLCYLDGMIYARGIGIKTEINTIGPDIEKPTSIGKFKLGFRGTPYMDYNYMKDYHVALKLMHKLGLRV